MNTTASRVPHLARAIFEKRCSQFRPKGIEALPVTSILSKPTSGSIHFPRNYSSDQPGFSSELRRRPRPSSQMPPPRQPPPPRWNDEPQLSRPNDRSERTRWYFVWAFLPFSGALGGYVMYVYISYTRDKQHYEMKADKLVLHSDVSDRWENENRDFDNEINGQENILFMRAKRRRLIREAYGDVLEVSVGTGRNMDLYDTRPYHPTEDSSYGRSARHMVTSLTFNDQSSVMIEHAKNKWEQKQKMKRQEDRFAGGVRWVSGDARQPGVISRPSGGYDTIVQSMGVCSMTEPVKFLRLLGRLVRQPGEDVQNDSPKKFREQEAEDGRGGRIFLLEHGRGKAEWLNNFLDSFAPMHADRYGCWCNKDIGKIINDSGLVVERVRRYHFGTVWEIVLRPSPHPLPGEIADISTFSAANQVQQQGQSVGITESIGRWISKIWK